MNVKSTCFFYHNKIYTKKEMIYWEELDRQVEEYANKSGFMYVIDEELFSKIQ